MSIKPANRLIMPDKNKDVIEEDSSLNKLNLKPGERLLLLGGYGVNNVGDEAILAGLLRKLPSDIHVRVISHAPKETSALHNVDAISPLRAITALLHCDVLIVGGGGIFSRHMGLMGRLIPLFCMMAKARRIRVAFHGIGVYPSTPSWVLRIIRWLAPHLTSFTVRDSISARTLRSCGLEVQQIPDLSTHMTPANSGKGAQIIRSLGLDIDIPTVALCLTATERCNEAYLMNTVPSLINAMPDVQFCFVPMSKHPKVSHHNDLLLAERIKSHAARLAILRTCHHPSEILAMFDHFDAALCMRYHSLLFAQRSGVGIIPIPYAEKCESWLDDYSIPPVDMDIDDIRGRLKELLSHKREHTEKL